MKYLILLLLLSGCGRGIDSVCGVPYSQTAAGPEVAREDVSPLAEASWKLLDENRALLEQGGFASSSDMTCQFGVKNGVVYR